MVERLICSILFIGVMTSCSLFQKFYQLENLSEQETVVIAPDSCALPCVFGITVGQTTYSQALEIIASLPEEQIIDDSGKFWVHGRNQQRIYVTIRRALPNKDDSISSIELSTHSQYPVISLGEILGSGWRPTKVFRNRIAGPHAVNLLLVFGEHISVFAEVAAKGSVNGDSAITSLTLVAPEDSEWVLEDIRLIRHYDDEIAWLGYLPVNDYWVATRKKN